MTAAFLDLGPAPRILYLSEDPRQVRAQLAGEQLAREEAAALRHDVSTDEISPVAIMSHYDDKLARRPVHLLRLRPAGSHRARRTDSRRGPQTLYEKIVRRYLLRTDATPGDPVVGEGCFVRADLRFIHEYYTGMAAHMLDRTLGTGHAPHQPEVIVVFEDHATYVDESPAHLRAGLVPNMHAMVRAQRAFVERHGLRFHRSLTDAEAAQDDGRHRLRRLLHGGQAPCSTERPTCATTASRAATTGRSSRPARASCSLPAAPAPTAARARRPTRAR